MSALSGMWAPVRQESVCNWVEKNVDIPTGAITGNVQLRKTPYCREILELYNDPATRHIVLAWATQLAKTSLLSWGMLFRIHRRPEDAIWVMGNADQYRDFNKERFMPYVRGCKPVMELVPKTERGSVDKHLWGFQNQHYRSMVLSFVGAGSATNLKSRPRGFVVMDEVDSYYDDMKFDAGTIQLAEARMKAFNFPLVVKASSPTYANRMIWQEYLKTDQRQYWVPCPRANCGELILLKFKIVSEKHGDCGLRWWHENEEEAKTDGGWDLKKVRANAFYKCQCCGGMIHSFEREDMIQTENGAIWKPQKGNAEAGRYGYNLGSMYSILSEETSLGAMAVKWLMAKGLASERKDFITGWLAEPYDESKGYDFEEIPLRLFTPQQISEDATSIMAADVQELGYWVLIRRFQKPSPEHPHGQSWLLYAGFAQTVEEIVALQQEYQIEGENITLDLAHRPNQVARTIIEHGWRGIWGSATRKFQWTIDGRKVWRPYSAPQFRDPMLGTSWESRTFKRAVFCLFSKHDALDMVASLRHAKPPIWHATVNVDPRYAAHLNTRVKIEEKNKRTGRVEWIWRETSQVNHLFDCEVHVTIRALQLGLLSLPNETEQMNIH